MIEILDFVEDETLNRLIYSNYICKREAGCVGVGLSYEPRFLLFAREVSRVIDFDYDFPPRRGYYYRPSLARLLYDAVIELGAKPTVEREKSEFSPYFYVPILADRWRSWCDREFGHLKIPIRISVTLDEDSEP